MCKNLIYFIVIGLFLGTVAHARTDVFSVNFYDTHRVEHVPGNVTIEPEQSAGLADWETAGWYNYLVPFQAADVPPVTITNGKGQTATLTLTLATNARGQMSADNVNLRALPAGDANGDLVDATALGREDRHLIFTVSDIPFAKYDVILYMGYRAARLATILFTGT
jgi:hypothetical protein